MVTEARSNPNALGILCALTPMSPSAPPWHPLQPLHGAAAPASPISHHRAASGRRGLAPDAACVRRTRASYAGEVSVCCGACVGPWAACAPPAAQCTVAQHCRSGVYRREGEIGPHNAPKTHSRVAFQGGRCPCPLPTPMRWSHLFVGPCWWRLPLYTSSPHCAVCTVAEIA